MIEKHHCGRPVVWQRGANDDRPILMDADPREAFRLVGTGQIALLYHKHVCSLRRRNEPDRSQRR